MPRRRCYAAASRNTAGAHLTRIKLRNQTWASIHREHLARKDVSIPMNNVTRKLVSLLGIVAVVFAQLAVSAYACPMQFIGDDDTVAAFEPNSSGRDAESPALCQKHCENGQQIINDAPQPLAAVTSAPAPDVTPTINQAEQSSAVAVSPSLLRVTAPPLAVRNCCLRI